MSEEREPGSSLNHAQINFAKTLVKENHPLQKARLA
jgi:hypothetical protein